MSKAIVVIALLLTLPLGALGQTLDGRWNGKAWDLAELKNRVALEDADALAEYAYCLRENWYDLTASRKEIFSYALRASEKGSPLGNALLARMYQTGHGVAKDHPKARLHAEKAHELGHPLGTKNLANLYDDGLADLPKDSVKAIELIQKAASEACLIAEYNLALCHIEGLNGFEIDLRKGYQSLERLTLKHEHDLAAYLIIKNVYYHRKIKEDRITKAALEQSLKTVTRRAMVGNDSASLCLLGCYHLFRGEDTIGVPLLLKGFKSPEPSKASRQILYYFANGYKIGRREKPLSAEGDTVREIARSAVDFLPDDRKIQYSTGIAFLYDVNNKKPDFPRALKHILEAYRLGDEDALTRIASVLLDQKRTPAEFQDLPTGIAILTYNAKDDTGAYRKLAYHLGQANEPYFDPVRAFVLSQAIGKETGSKSSSKRHREKAEALKDTLSEKQLVEAKSLKERSYPLAEEFRSEALRRIETHPSFLSFEFSE